MPRLLLFGLLFVSTVVNAAPPVVLTDPLPPAEQQKKFKLPPGFEIQLVIAEPDIGQPMNLNFDARGRLWITSSIEYPYPAKGDVEPRSRFKGQGDHEPRDRLTVVESFAPDGRAAKITQFVGGLNIPIGHVPLRNGGDALVYSIPNIYHCRDTNGDGIADTRDVLYGKFGNIDTHGMASSFTRWIDGWIYGTHGFANTSEVKDRSGNVVKMNSGNTYRFREDGSHFQQFTWGQVNPFGMAFDSLGNLYDSDCHSKPVYMLLRGAYYPSFGKPHDGLGYAPAMINHDHGSTGICGPAIYAADQYPPDYRDNLFICNPVTGQVHRDHLRPQGSTLLVDTQPQFVECEDGWFRPVDLKLGPDGALYIADFYNCIIGHYEVPLDHPRRDRDHGRVWRVVYKGEGSSPTTSPPDLTTQAIPALAALLGSPNLAVRTLATNQLVDRGQAGDEALRASIGAAVREVQTENHFARAHGMWVLERLGSLDDAALQKLVEDPDRLVRVHAVKLLAERPTWSAPHRKLVAAATKDSDPFVQRAAADALGLHPQGEQLDLLLSQLASAPANDTHLRHVIRIALRQHLADDSIREAAGKTKRDPSATKLLAELALAVKSPGAAAFVLSHLESSATLNSESRPYLEFVSQHASDADLPRVIEAVRRSAGSNSQSEFTALQGLRAGIEKRGLKSDPLAPWATHLVDRLLAGNTADAPTWTSVPISGATTSADPWVRQERVSDDNQKAIYWSSLPRGEQLTGVLRSRSFVLPAKFSFYMAGHNGLATQPETVRNFVRLRDAETHELLAEAKPPRHDTARRFEWNLEKQAGRRGYLELIDGFVADGYAWLAVGRFSVDELNHDQFHSLQAALTLVGQHRLESFKPQLLQLVDNSQADSAVRIAAGQSLLTFSPDSRLLGLLSIAGVVTTAAPQREAILKLVASPDGMKIQEQLVDAMNRAPQASQSALADTLAGDKVGAESLLQLVSSGRASPRLLQRASVRQKLEASQLENVKERIATLTANQPTESQELLKLIGDRVKSFNPAKADLSKGAAIFEKTCQACHKLGGKGAMIGPQLDGIGNRGPERLMEDILDTNRNVDPVFRSSTLILSSGKVVVGLVRRTEGQTLIVADSQGKEVTIPLSEIDERKPSPLSLMPANFGETLPPDDFQSLVAFLLQARSQSGSQP